MTEGTLTRLFRAALGPPDDPATQEESGRLIRLIGLQEVLGSDQPPWISVDPLHDTVEQHWSSLGMPSSFEWVYAWTAAPITNDGKPVLLSYIRRSQPTPNQVRGLDVPFEQVRAGEGFGFGVLGLVVPEDLGPSCWRICTASGAEIFFMKLTMTIQIPGHGDVADEFTPTGMVRREGPFNPSAPDEKTLARARRALTMIPKGMGGRRRGWRKGQVWSAQQNVKWWLAWELDIPPEPQLSHYAAAIGLRDEDTASQRWKDSGLDWPPTPAQLDEFSD